MEIWKDIIWYEWIYKISNLWRVKSFKNWRWGTKKTWYILKPTVRDWYNTISIWRTERIHRLVAQHFIPNQNNLPFVCHKKENNPSIDKVDNLFWGTQKDNIQDMMNKWRSWSVWIKWKLHKQSKKVKQIRDWIVINIWDSMADIYRELWIDHISDCCKGKRNTSWWFKWEYV